MPWLSFKTTSIGKSFAKTLNAANGITGPVTALAITNTASPSFNCDFNSSVIETSTLTSARFIQLKSTVLPCDSKESAMRRIPCSKAPASGLLDMLNQSAFQ